VKEPYRNANELFDREDIYQSIKVDGKWNTPLNLGKPINTPEHDAIVALSPDGNTMFLYKASGEGDLYYAKKTKKGWTKPESLGSNINTKYSETSISVTADGKTIYFSSNRPGGFGGFDIYKSERKENGRYDRPENLGPVINTSDDDDSPFIHPDGVSLYFSSKGHATMGGYDIFVSIMDSTGEWSLPQNLGYPINTTKDDIYFVLSADNKHGYYSSEKAGGYGSSDCYLITMPTRQMEEVVEKEAPKKFNFDVGNAGTPKMVLQVATQKTVNPITIFKGKIFDDLTKEPLETEIIITDNVTGQKLSDIESGADGSFLIVLNSGKNYGIAVTKKGYLFHSENFDLPPSSDYQEVEKDIYLKKAALGTKIVLRNIFFDFDKATLRKESTKELERLLGILKENPTLKVEIAGHTDNIGSAEYNQKLSENRAQAVVDYLIEQGIDKKRLTYAGYGLAKPMTSNDTEKGRQLNRRTEFEIKGI
jgi:outer membrane protein OmpA-like peptidoglycan-associated protein